MEELLKKIPPEKCWAITAKILTTFALLRGVKIVLPLLGTGEGIISPVWGWEKWYEINEKIWTEGGKKVFPKVKEAFNIPVEDAIGADNLESVVGILFTGPEFKCEYVEKNPKRVIFRMTKCAWMERYKELEVDPELRVCYSGCPGLFREGLKAVNPKITRKATKFMPRGDPYCEGIIEFKEE